MIFRALALCLLLATLMAEDPANVPGYFPDLPCVEEPLIHSIDLIIPAGYTDDSTRRFPALFISRPKGDPDITPYRAWADRLGFIVVGIDNSRDGDRDGIIRAQDLALQTLAQRGLRLHHCLNYAATEGGASTASVLLTSRMPDQFAGVHLAVHTGDGSLVPAHQAVAIYASASHKKFPVERIKRTITALRRQGNPVQVEFHPDGHKGAPAAIIMRDVEWMYWRSLLTHPALSRDELDTNLARVAAQADSIAGLADPAQRCAAYGRLLACPTTAASPVGERMIAAWTEDLDRAVAQASRLDQYWLLSEAVTRPWYEDIERKRRRSHRQQLKELLDDETIGAEHIAATAYRKVEALAEDATTTTQQDEVAAGWKAIAERFPSTRFGRQAAERYREAMTPEK